MQPFIQKLLTVKSIITILLTVAFIVLSMYGTITGEQVFYIYTMVISFYFGTQTTKGGNKV